MIELQRSSEAVESRVACLVVLCPGCIAIVNLVQSGKYNTQNSGKWCASPMAISDQQKPLQR